MRNNNSVHVYLTQFPLAILSTCLHLSPTSYHKKGSLCMYIYIYTYINPTGCHTRAYSNRSHISKALQTLSLSLFDMAKSSTISLVFILLLVCYNIPSLESRKMLSMEKRDVSSMEESLDLALLPKGPPVPPSSPSGEGYAMVNINGKLFTLHLQSINDRVLTQSVPSPGVGHH